MPLQVTEFRRARFRARIRTEAGAILVRRASQVAYLRDLQKRHKISAPEMARLSRVFADSLQQPSLAFKQQAAWAWLNGTRTPRPEHRRALALIFQVPWEELNRALDESPPISTEKPVVRPVLVHLQRNDRDFEYRLTVRNDIDLAQPAVYRHWAEVFQPEPVRLKRHLERSDYACYGWVPDTSLSPLVRHPRSMVPLSAGRSALGDVNTIDKRCWFLYLPDGKLDFGIAFQEGRWLHLAKPNRSGTATERYPLSRVDLVGYIAGRVLFQVELL